MNIANDQSHLRPRRSVLYLPASNERALAKASTLACDSLILDLEDAVAPDLKPQARQQASRAVLEAPFGRREVAIRVNGMNTPWYEDDLAAVSECKPDAVLIPKVADAAMVHQVLADLERHNAPMGTKLWAMIETPSAIVHCAEIAAATPQLLTLVIGTNDLAKELGVRDPGDRSTLDVALKHAVLAARNAGVCIVDGVFNNFRDEAGLRMEAEQGYAWGMDGKTLIHPAQIAVANEVFSPRAEELTRAHTLIEAWDQREDTNAGVIVVDGTLVEELHVTQARTLVARQAKIDALSSN